MTSTASIYLPIAKACGVPVTIAHARSAGVDAGIKGLATRVLRLSLPGKCDYMLSCSGLASVSVFGQRAYDAGKVIYAPNAIDTQGYAYNEDARRQVRSELGIDENAFVIGHVGRFDPVKNQTLLAQAAGLLHHADPEVDFRFLFVGGGDLQETVQAIFREEGIPERAVMAGICDPARTAQMYSAMDLFCLPSLYEGLPGTVLEAQAAGLPCLISSVITDEVMVTGSVQKLSNADEKVWASTIDKAFVEIPAQGGDYRAQRSQDALAALARAGFDIARSSQVMQSWYEALAREPHAHHELSFQ